PRLVGRRGDADEPRRLRSVEGLRIDGEAGEELLWHETRVVAFADLPRELVDLLDGGQPEPRRARVHPSASARRGRAPARARRECVRGRRPPPDRPGAPRPPREWRARAPRPRSP